MATGRPRPDAVFVKRRTDAPDGFYAVEAAGLAWLTEAEAHGGPRVVRVRAVTDHSLTLERLEPGEGPPDAARTFGAALARLHRSGAGWFGAPPPAWTGDGFIGPLPLPHLGRDDPAAEHWDRFYARARLEPFVRSALRRGALDDAAALAVHRVAARLEDGDPDLTGPPEPPARLHGDLWSGNVVWTASGAVLIDPAAHGGHRETDLAMLALFGAPGLEAILDGYQAVHPLAAGWQERVALHQLHPLLVHAVLFGRSYGAEVAAVAARLNA